MTFVRALVRLAALWIAAAPGCAPGVSVAVAPEVAARRPARELRLPAIYKGDPRHLPLSVIAVTLTDAPFEYGYEVSYEREDVGGFIGHLNPLMLFGYPAGRSRAVV